MQVILVLQMAMVLLFLLPGQETVTPPGKNFFNKLNKFLTN